MSYFDIVVVQDVAGVSRMTEGIMEQGGLGINFYEEGHQKDEVKEAEISTGSGHVQLPLPAASPAQPQQVGTPPAKVAELQTPNFKPFKSQDNPPLDLIEKLLEENYRGQAETFVRKSSQASIRSLSQTSSRSSPVASSIRQNSNGTFERPRLVFTPTRKPSRGAKVDSARSLQNLRTPTPNSARRVILETFQERSGSTGKNNRSGFSPESGASPSPHITYGHRLYSVPRIPKNRPTILKRSERFSKQIRGPLYFTTLERQAIAELVHANPRECERHPNCTDCHNLEYAYFENKTMPTSMSPEERQKIINNNRSLRNIKTELENLAESSAISDAAYDTIMQSLPAESSLNGPAPSRSTGNDSISQSAASIATPLSNLSVSNPAPPAYNNPTPPALPGRTPAKPEIARATALYRYAEVGDCNFEVGDEVSVYEYMNAEWWLGRNIRTGQEGVFPVNYVQVQTNPSRPGGFDGHISPTPPANYYGNEKAGGYQPQQYQQGPPPPGPSNPYNSAVPPMQIADQPVESRPGKGHEMGKKFGRKLGNAAIFGAGATLGGDLVNSIF